MSILVIPAISLVSRSVDSGVVEYRRYIMPIFTIKIILLESVNNPEKMSQTVFSKRK